VGLRPFAYWDCGLESHGGHGSLSLVSAVCCQVEVSASDWSRVQRSPTECGVSNSVIVKPRKMRWPRPPRGCRATEIKMCYGTNFISVVTRERIENEVLQILTRREQ
jgi:hypothetical protein